MAWQTPKTNWSAADGVRNTDFNRIEGNILALYYGSLHAATTLYVNASTGNDTTGTGSAGAPFKTITMALSVLPKDLGGFAHTISITAGTYAETVNIHNFFGGTIALSGASGAAVSISGLDIRGCNVLLSNINLTVTGSGVFVGEKAMFYCGSGTITVSGAVEAFTLRYGAVVEITTTLTVNNSTSRALQAQYASTVSIANLAGTANNVGIFAYQSTVFVRNMTLAATLQTVNENSILNVGGAVA